MSETSNPDAAELQLAPLEAEAPWLLSSGDLAAVPETEAHNRLGFGVLLGYVRREGRFPEHPAVVPEESVARIAGQLGVPATSWQGYVWGGSTWGRHRREIRARLGFRPCTVHDGHALAEQNLLFRIADAALAHPDAVVREVVFPIASESVLRAPVKQPRVNRITYEICALEALREKLRCKEIWVEGADRYRNPEQDLPQDFEVQRAAYYAALELPAGAEAFTEALQQEMVQALQRLDATLGRNPHMQIKPNGQIVVSPLATQAEPQHLAALKAEIADEYPMTSLLDTLKEADLRLGFTDAFRTAGSHEQLDWRTLQTRLLLCLHGMGTNAGLRRMHATQNGTSYKNLLYTRKRYINADRLREAITTLVNGTLRARQAEVWGEGTTACASDSKHFGAWDQSLMTKWHIRYGGPGVMVYWHVEKKSLCIYSQRKTTWFSEAASMIEGVLRSFTRSNVQHPTYRALAELGKSVKTVFLCRYLHSEALRREIHEGLNVIEQWNSVNDFIFFGRRGEMTSNRRDDHEESMLALHLLQNCLVYANTLMVQRVLARPHWRGGTDGGRPPGAHTADQGARQSLRHLPARSGHAPAVGLTSGGA